jgi:signal transduction histidine kinase
MASGVVHDLNQSLTLIAGYAELLDRELAGPVPDVDRLRDYAAILYAAATDGGEMAGRLLALSRVQASAAPVDVSASVAAARRRAAHRAALARCHAGGGLSGVAPGEGGRPRRRARRPRLAI